MSALRQTKTAGWFALHIRTEFEIFLVKVPKSRYEDKIFLDLKF